MQRIKFANEICDNFVSKHIEFRKSHSENPTIAGSCLDDELGDYSDSPLNNAMSLFAFEDSK